jgi:large subunit ribosomal protein L24
MLIKSGDTVEVTTGNDRGTRAKVVSVHPAASDREANRIIVEGVNRVYRHVRKSQKNQQGGRLSKEMPIDASNVLFVCSACGKATRLGARINADGSKVRCCKKCGAEHGVLRRPRAAAKTAS